MQKYELGNMDRYAVAVNGTVMENASFFKATLKRDVDGVRLLSAVNIALDRHPLFKTRVRYKGQYFLEENDLPVTVTYAGEAGRPKHFGKSTNGYPWRVCWEGPEICFEWCHVITDGRGAIAFLSDILSVYFGVPLSDMPDLCLDTGFERFFDKSVKPFGQKKQEKGFRPAALPAVKNGFRCQSHILAIETKQLLAVAKKTDSTPAAILAPLLSKAVRARIPLSEKNRNVSCGIVVDCRKIMDFNCAHNFILNKVITYTDRMDRLDFPTVCTVYRSILDISAQRENMVAAMTDMVRQTDFLYRLRPLFLQRFIMKIVARAVKNGMNNIGLTYLGRVPFAGGVIDELENFGFRSWPDIGACVAAAVDLRGTIFVDICENYADKGVVPAFIGVCAEYGIDVKTVCEREFEQAAMII